MPQTLYDKLWDSHVVHVDDDGTALLYIDRHLVHEVTSAQAYEGLKVAGRKPWRVDSVVATADHNTPTTNWDEGMAGVRDKFAKLQIETLDGREIKPHVTWGTSPEMVTSIDSVVPDPEKEKDSSRREGMERALVYMGLKPRTRITDIKLDKVFIGSCTNSRIEDLRAAAAVVKGRRKAANIQVAMVVPGSGLVKAQAEKEGLDRIFRDAGFEWREPGCSMCLGMNPDRLSPGERCASTSNRNFEGRQGEGGRTHLVSPAMAAAAAIAGHFVDIREWR